ncbi:MAG: hypothetical protein ACOY33_07065 [Pseudomonadota bacterium]
MEETKTFDPREGDSVLSAYGISCTRHGDDFLLMLWNQTHSVEEGVGCIQANVSPARASVIDLEPPDNTIPGYPTYFWILPEHDAYCTVTMENRLSGNHSFVRYMSGFLKKCPRHTVYEADDREDFLKLVGYGLDNQVAMRGLKPSFKTEVVRSDGELNDIRVRLPEVTRMIRRKTLTFNERDQRGVIERLCSFVGRRALERVGHEFFLQYDIAGPVDEAEFQEIVDIYNQEQGEWDDVGFKFRGSADLKWLGHGGIRLKNSIELPVGRTNLPNPGDFHDQLLRFRRGIVDKLERLNG